MAILNAIQTASGLRGTCADAFGIDADPREKASMRAVVSPADRRAR
jgi:hypothetical protein